jgi:Fe-S-cluster containining protein
MKFECSQCGICCRVLTPGQLQALGLPQSPMGGCGNLLPDNTCSIYETRPDFCRVDRLRRYFTNWTDDEFVKMNHAACDSLIEAYGDANTPRRSKS